MPFLGLCKLLSSQSWIYSGTAPRSTDQVRDFHFSEFFHSLVRLTRRATPRTMPRASNTESENQHAARA
jgi:hypothetical protein